MNDCRTCFWRSGVPGKDGRWGCAHKSEVCWLESPKEPKCDGKYLEEPEPSRHIQ